MGKKKTKTKEQKPLTANQELEKWLKDNCKKGERLQLYKSNGVFLLCKEITFAYRLKDEKDED